MLSHSSEVLRAEVAERGLHTGVSPQTTRETSLLSERRVESGVGLGEPVGHSHGTSLIPCCSLILTAKGIAMHSAWQQGRREADRGFHPAHLSASCHLWQDQWPFLWAGPLGHIRAPKHGALTQQVPWQAPRDRPAASELILKACCPLDMRLLCGGQEGGPVTEVWKQKPRSLGFNLDQVSVKLCLHCPRFGVPIIQCDLQTGSGFLTNYLTSSNLSFSALKMGVLIPALPLPLGRARTNS